MAFDRNWIRDVEEMCSEFKVREKAMKESFLLLS